MSAITNPTVHGVSARRYGSWGFQPTGQARCGRKSSSNWPRARAWRSDSGSGVSTVVDRAPITSDAALAWMDEGTDE